jgi:hypothetical protein
MICAADSLPSISWMRPSMKALAVFGGVVFGVLAQVALGARFGNGIDDPGAVNGFQLVQLGLQALCAALGNGNGCHVFAPAKAKPPPVTWRRRLNPKFQ